MNLIGLGLRWDKEVIDVHAESLEFSLVNNLLKVSSQGRMELLELV